VDGVDGEAQELILLQVACTQPLHRGRTVRQPGAPGPKPLRPVPLAGTAHALYMLAAVAEVSVLTCENGC
jgi:hypothetical protein